jgi:hypothetical protein
MNHIPNENQIEKLLEQTAPHTIGQLEKRLAAAPWTAQAVQRRNTIGISTVAILMVSLIFAATPQGYALAQEILRFFTRTESDTYYSPVSDLTFEDTTPFHEQCGISIRPTCSVEEVRARVDFEVKQVGVLPEGLGFVGATGGPDFVELKYEYPNRFDGMLGVVVEAVGRPSPIGTGITSQSANVQPVQIGDLPGEYFTGILFQDEQGNVNWIPDDPTTTLRWEDGGSTYTMVYFSRSIPLTIEDLVAAAETMTTESISQ